jgi:hypothetical protein
VRARMEFGLNQSGGIRIRPANLTAIPTDPFHQQATEGPGQLDLSTPTTMAHEHQQRNRQQFSAQSCGLDWFPISASSGEAASPSP